MGVGCWVMGVGSLVCHSLCAERINHKENIRKFLEHASLAREISGDDKGLSGDDEELSGDNGRM